MRNMAVLHSPAFSYPLPVLVRVLSNLLIFKGKILYYNKDSVFLKITDILVKLYSLTNTVLTSGISHRTDTTDSPFLLSTRMAARPL